MFQFIEIEGWNKLLLKNLKNYFQFYFLKRTRIDLKAQDKSPLHAGHLHSNLSPCIVFILVDFFENPQRLRRRW